MHVVLLNQAFHPDVVATAQMAKDLADALVKQGHTVTAISSRSIYGKSGAVLPKRETVDGIEVHRVGFSLFGKAGTAARLERSKLDVGPQGTLGRGTSCSR